MAMTRDWTIGGACLIAMVLLVVPAVPDDHEGYAQAETQSTPQMSPDMQALFEGELEASEAGEMTNQVGGITPMGGMWVKCTLGSSKAWAKPAGFNYGCPASGPTYGVDGWGDYCSAWTDCPSTPDVYCDGYVGAPAGSCYSTATLVSCEGTIYYC
jgi:hypothetical protein